MRAFSPAAFGFPLPPGHRFPLYKYPAVARLVGEHLPVLQAPPLDWAAAEAVHDPEHLRRWRAGALSAREVREFGLPWSAQVVERAARAAAGSLAALQDALSGGVGINLAGGTHHAFFDSAQGFCLLNDAAMVTHAALQGWVHRVLVLDLDVHQGDGTAALLAGEPRAFSLSVHGARNYPFRKRRSDLDIGLEDGVTDAQYLEVLRGEVLPAVDAFAPDLIVFLAGVDVLAGDRFGRFALSLAGVEERSRVVYRYAAERCIPLVHTMAGGYNGDHQLTVRAHAGAVLAGVRAWRGVAGTNKPLALKGR